MNAGLKRSGTICLAMLIGCLTAAVGRAEPGEFAADRDLLSLHYDHAPDKDDGHSAAADRTVLESLFGRTWLADHVVAVSGAYGTNAKMFNSKSDPVMDAVWLDCGGWVAAHTNREQAVLVVAGRWHAVLVAGGDVWVKEGGPSDVTAQVVARIRQMLPDIETTRRVHVVQHSGWNEKHTTPAALAYTKEHTHYIRIRDANRYLNKQGGNRAFEKAAREHPVFGAAWRAAFNYYAPGQRLDFSDTGELLHLLGLGELGVDAFRARFLDGLLSSGSSS